MLPSVGREEENVEADRWKVGCVEWLRRRLEGVAESRTVHHGYRTTRKQVRAFVSLFAVTKGVFPNRKSKTRL
jgi:hypothetical protein